MFIDKRMGIIKDNNTATASTVENCWPPFDQMETNNVDNN